MIDATKCRSLSFTSPLRILADLRLYNTLNMALRRMDYDKSQMTAHGFRSMASTNLHEQGWLHDAIERQLAHGKRDKAPAPFLSLLSTKN